MAGYAYEFGAFRFEPWPPARLLRLGLPVPLTPKAFDTLLALVRNHGRLVTKRELMDAVWPGVHVEEIGLARNISVLRKALGGSDDERFIETIPRQGYRFVAGVTAVRRPSHPDAEAEPGAIAVLPLKQIGSESAESYLGLGIADALIARLSGLRQLVVRPTNAVRLYGSHRQDPTVAGRALRVDWVLDGCLQLNDDRVRVTVQLVRIDDAATLWAEKYDEPVTDIFTLEDSISKRVAEVLAVRLSAEELTKLGKRGTASAEAHHLLEGPVLLEQEDRRGTAKGDRMLQRSDRRGPEPCPGLCRGGGCLCAARRLHQRRFPPAGRLAPSAGGGVQGPGNRRPARRGAHVACLHQIPLRLGLGRSRA